MRDFRGTKGHAGLLIAGLALAFMFPAGNVAVAQSAPAIDILIGSASGEAGSQVDIDVDLETNGAEPSVIVLTLLYDATKLSFVGVAAGEAATQAGKSIDIRDNVGELGVVIWGGRTVLEDGNLFVVAFGIRSATAPQVLNIATDGSESASEINAATPILVTVDPGNITVKEGVLPRCGGQLKIMDYGVQDGAGSADVPQADAGIFLAMAAVLGMKCASRRGRKK